MKAVGCAVPVPAASPALTVTAGTGGCAVPVPGRQPGAGSRGCRRGLRGTSSGSEARIGGDRNDGRLRGTGRACQPGGDSDRD